jgi:hypothetical protein
MMFLVDLAVVAAMFKFIQELVSDIKEKDYIGIVLMTMIIALTVVGIIYANVFLIHAFGMTAVTS